MKDLNFSLKYVVYLAIICHIYQVVDAPTPEEVTDVKYNSAFPIYKLKISFSQAMFPPILSYVLTISDTLLGKCSLKYYIKCRNCKEKSKGNTKTPCDKDITKDNYYDFKQLSIEITINDASISSNHPYELNIVAENKDGYGKTMKKHIMTGPGLSDCPKLKVISEPKNKEDHKITYEYTKPVNQEGRNYLYVTRITKNSECMLSVYSQCGDCNDVAIGDFQKPAKCNERKNDSFSQKLDIMERTVAVPTKGCGKECKIVVYPVNGRGWNLECQELKFKCEDMCCEQCFIGCIIFIIISACLLIVQIVTSLTDYRERKRNEPTKAVTGQRRRKRSRKGATEDINNDNSDTKESDKKKEDEHADVGNKNKTGDMANTSRKMSDKKQTPIAESKLDTKV